MTRPVVVAVSMLMSYAAVADCRRALSVEERKQLLEAMKQCWTRTHREETENSRKVNTELELKVDGAFKKLLSLAGTMAVNTDFSSTTKKEIEDLKAPENVRLMLELCHRGAFGDDCPPPPPPPAPASPVRVKAASIDAVDVTPASCSAKSPCGQLRRGSSLHLELTLRGYAIAYLEDKGFYAQEGRFVVSDGLQGDVDLWPGTDEAISGSVYALYVVTNGTRPATTSASTRLETLPAGERFGPIYLRVAKPSHPAP